MTVSSRYAIYIAPPADTELWRFGSQVLGYDAATGADLPGFTCGLMTAADWAVLASRPRTYGFHATLKAPFRLTEVRTAQDLADALGKAAAGHAGFDAGPLAVTSIADGGKGFVALTLQRASAELARLEADIVQGLDRFRAPLTEAEIAARRPERLSPRQRENLALWGYPHVGPDYMFHMTLTGETDRAAEIADALAGAYANRVGSARLLIEDLVLFEQPGPGERFRIIGRFPLKSFPDLRMAATDRNLNSHQGAPSEG